MAPDFDHAQVSAWVRFGFERARFSAYDQCAMCMLTVHLRLGIAIFI